ncbi:thioesterase [Clostridia bacterium]|nr:thioesterase [Clostridia bacterium]
MENLTINKKLRKDATVTKELLASTVGSGTIDVYATPMVVALMESAAAQLAAAELPVEFTTVGTKISIDHISATPVNAEVYATAEMTFTDGRKFEFVVEAYDNAGLIAKGTHERFSVNAEKFLLKAQSKFDKAGE